MRSLGIVFALLFLACNSTPTEPVSSVLDHDATVVLKFGESTRLTSDLRVSFAEVVEDSRCPASVVCAWQGNGAIRLDVTTGGATQSIRLNTAGGDTFPREATVAGYTFTLVELDPQRQTPDPVPPQQYRATLRVARSR